MQIKMTSISKNDRTIFVQYERVSESTILPAENLKGWHFLSIEPLPRVSENALRRADEIRAPSRLGSQSHDHSSGVRQGSWCGDS